MDPNNHVNTFNPTVENEHVFDWFYNGDSSIITSKSSGSPLISSVESNSFDESLNNFINGVNNYDPYFDSSMVLIPAPPYNHDEVEAYAHHNHITSTNAGLTSSSSSTSVVDFNILHSSFEELFPLLDEDLNIHEPLNILHPDKAINNNVNHLISDQINSDQMVNDDQGIIIIDDNDDSSHEDLSKKQASKKAKKKYGNGKAVLIGFNEISKHFDVPITTAAKRLNVGLTALKKRCRELNIERWPHRKIQSLKSLIHNLKEDEFGYCKEIEMLEEHKRMMEKLPDMDLTEQTKKIRQACFKVNYKKRRSSLASSSPSSSSSMVPSSIYSS